MKVRHWSHLYYCVMAASNSAIEVQWVVCCDVRVMSVGVLAMMVPASPVAAMPLRRNALAIQRRRVGLSPRSV